MLSTPPLPATHLGAGDRSRTLTWAMSSASAEPPIDIATHYVRPHVATAGRTCPAGPGPGGRGGPPPRHAPRPRPGSGPGPRRSCRFLRSPATARVPKLRSQLSKLAYPAAVAGNSRTPSSPPMGSSAAATCISACVSTPPVMTRAVSTMVTAIPFQVRDGTHPLAVGPVNPGLLSRPGRSDRQRRWVPETGTRPTDRFAGQPERRQPIRRSGRDPGSRPYAPITSRSGKPGRKHYPTLSLPTRGA